jgi:HlyD family secretion protein
MEGMTSRRTLWLIVAGVVLVGAVVAGFLPRAVPVDLVAATRGPLTVTVEEEGKTRVIDRYVVSAPVAGYARRNELDVGDLVKKGDPLLELEPLRSDVLDPRRRAEAEARVASARSAMLAAEQNASAAEADEELARLELERIEKLGRIQYVSAGELDRARAQARSAAANLRSAQFALEVAHHELDAAQTALEYSAATDGNDSPEMVDVRSPVDGRVLRLLRESEGVVASGESLVELGDPTALEVEVDVLSSDAVRIAPGTRVVFHRWGGEGALDGVVRVVEPTGFTKISALGVEEQRVLVISDITSPAEDWSRLGDGYRVEASFVLWHEDDVLQVPASALFRHKGSWATFVHEDGRAVLTPVTSGARNGLQVQILAGLEEGTEVVIHPGDDVAPGGAIKTRPPAR